MYGNKLLKCPCLKSSLNEKNEETEYEADFGIATSNNHTDFALKKT